MKKVIIAIVVVAIAAVAIFFGLKNKKVNTVAQNETTIVETTVPQTTVAETTTETAQALKKDDFIMKKDGNPTNLVDSNDKFKMIPPENKDAETNRGIKIGDSKEKVLVTYGEVEISPISRQDSDLYDYLKNQSDIDQRIKDALDDGDMYAKYVYHDDEKDKDYAIGFWFDPEENVKWVFSYEEGLETEEQLESEIEEELEKEETEVTE